MLQKLFNCYNTLCNFTTYHGEKIYGLLVQAIDDPSRHFIIPTYHKNYPNPPHNILKEWKEKENENSQSSVLEKYGYEIRDENVITHCEPDQSAPGEKTKTYRLIEDSQQGRTERKVEKLFIFGAGASYGMSYNSDFHQFEWRPPLVNQLFDE